MLISQAAVQISLGDLPFIKDLCNVIGDYIEPIRELLKGVDIAQFICNNWPETCEYMDVLEKLIAIFGEKFDSLLEKASRLCNETN